MAFEGWDNGQPPKAWDRILAIDVGGATPWCWLFSAIDPFGNIIVYDEIYLITTDVEKLVNLALPKMKAPDGTALTFRYKVCDYENRVAMADIEKMSKRVIRVDGALKHGKAGSIHRLHGYLHPNEQHHFPNWHPAAGTAGSPRLFIAPWVKNLIRELPQQRWKEQANGLSLKDEPDRTIDNHAVDCLLYTVRQLPNPTELKATPGQMEHKAKSLISRMYWEDVQRRKEQLAPEGRKTYRITRGGVTMLN